MLYPLKFRPIFKQYIWGGRNLERLFQKPIPPEGPVAESWEIVDRDEENSVVANGPLAGMTLRLLMQNHHKDMLGHAEAWKGRFPLLVKILDAQERLSLQVHPPAHVAEKLGGEPKTEMWYVCEARSGACFYVGLREGVTRERFEQAIKDETVEECFHRITIKAGDVMFLPSGRVHAIGGHCVLYEIQQNSDTTYRVYDWRRVGPDGKPRELHIEQALQCIDFNDFEPSLAQPMGPRLVECPWFTVERHAVDGRHQDRCEGSSFHVLCCLNGKGALRWKGGSEPFAAGDTLFLPAKLGEYEVDGRRLGLLKVYVGR